ncbi:uncharacterized protein METZ01_LOCUS382950, partial [marine metagenome]
ESNPRPAPYQGTAIPLSHDGSYLRLRGAKKSLSLNSC